MDKVNFKIYDLTTWLTNDYNTCCPMSHEVKATRQLDLASKRM